jgi:CRP-like cAMP-binding protein
VQVAHVRAVPSGSCFFLQSDPATRFYVLLHGRVRLTQVTAEGQQVILRFITPGEGMGIVAALGTMDYPASAEALDACQALMWEGTAVAALMERYPRLALNGMRLLAQRVREFQDRLRELATERVERRVARMLLRLARQSGHKVAGGILIDLPLSRQTLAEMTGTTLYTVSRILSQWEAQNLVESGRERVVIRHPHGLVVIADDLPQIDDSRA